MGDSADTTIVTPPSAEAPSAPMQAKTKIEAKVAPKVEHKVEHKLESVEAKPAVDKKPTVETSAKRENPFAKIGATLVAPLAARPRLSRVAVLTIAIAISAALGSVVGAIAGAALIRSEPEPAPVPTMNANALKGTLAQLSGEIASLKASIESNAKTSSTQMARISDRVERAEKSQGEPSAKIARIADAVDRLEKKTTTAAAVVAPDVTGSIVPKQQPQEARAEPKLDDKPPVVSGWVLREIFNGRAMVENRREGLFEVVPGARLPGLGRVERIRQIDGRWVVVTPKGMIVSER